MIPITIAIDAMGGDNAPQAPVEGAVMALAEMPVNILLVGQEERIEAELAKLAVSPDKRTRIKIIHAAEIIETHEVPTTAIRRKRDSSMVVGFKAVKEGQAQAFVSAGSTGALLTGATVKIGRAPGIERPALGTVLPTDKPVGYTFLIDCGANVDAKPFYLLQFAQMGAAYMSKTMGLERPKVGLINIGAEKEKGNALTKEAYELLEQSDLNFVGNVEARDVPHGAVDVAVCDAFVGNVVLKYTEGLAKALLGMIKRELMADPLSKAGAFLAQGAFKRLKKNFDYAEVGGAPFLGLNALVIKAHGSSNARAICSAIRQCSKYGE